MQNNLRETSVCLREYARKSAFEVIYGPHGMVHLQYKLEPCKNFLTKGAGILINSIKCCTSMKPTTGFNIDSLENHDINEQKKLAEQNTTFFGFHLVRVLLNENCFTSKAMQFVDT